MITSRRGIDFIKYFEGFSSKPYKCPSGYITIGYGHRIIKSAGRVNPVSPAQAHNILKEDVKYAEKAIHNYIASELQQCEFDALCSFTFNLGAGALQRSTLRQKINYGDHTGAALEFPKWVFSGGRRSRGLIRRRQAEKNLFEDAKYMYS